MHNRRILYVKFQLQFPYILLKYTQIYRYLVTRKFVLKFTRKKKACNIHGNTIRETIAISDYNNNNNDITITTTTMHSHEKEKEFLS